MTGAKDTAEVYRIAHGFADKGLEDYTLSQFGHVTRYTLNPEANGVSTAIQCDLSDPDAIPEPEEKFDFGVWQPVCNKYASTTSISGDPDEWPDLIDEAREIAEKTCHHWIIENKPQAWNDDVRPEDPTVVLEGKHFGLPVKYQRGFEANFDIPQPARNAALGGDGYETSPFYDSEKSLAWWAAMKGVPAHAAAKGYISRNCIPRAYLSHILMAWQDARDEELGIARSDFSDYDAQMDVRRAKEANHELGLFADGGNHGSR